MSTDEIIIKCLLEGMTQPEIAEHLKNTNNRAYSLSSVEKHLKRLRERYKAKTMFHLGAIIALKKYIRS